MSRCRSCQQRTEADGADTGGALRRRARVESGSVQGHSGWPRRCRRATLDAVIYDLTRRSAMSPFENSTNLTARLGRWSARHRKTAIFGWLAFVVAAVAVGATLGTQRLD